MEKVIIITYYWPPSGGAGVQRSLKFAKYLPEYNIEPVIITVAEDAASYPIIDETLSAEVSKDLRVIRTKSFEPLKILSAVAGKNKVPHGGFAGTNKQTFFQRTLRFIRGNFFIPDARKGWVKYAVKAASELIERENIKTVIVSSPPHSSQLIGLALKKKYGIKWIADMRDPWTDIYYYGDLLHTGFAKRKDLETEKEIVEKADQIIVVSDSIKILLEDKLDSPDKNKFTIIPNGFDESDFIKIHSADKNTFTISYIGTIADSYYPEMFLMELKKVIKNFNSVNIRLKFIGSITSKVKELVQETGLSGFTSYESHVSHSNAIQFMNEASALLLIIPEAHNNKGILTGKLFEYLASRKPIIGIGPVEGDAAKILNSLTAGSMFNRSQNSELNSYISKLILNWQLNPDNKNDNDQIGNYSRRQLTGKLASLILN